MEIADLVHVTASFNVAGTISILLGYYFIRQGNKVAHKRAMLTTVGLAVGFLIVYIYYHANAGLAAFGGQGFVRTFYFSLLASHVFLAVVVVIAVPVVLTYALKGDFTRHPRLARWVLPVWLYVMVTGVIVYVMAVHLYPGSAPMLALP